MSKRLFDFLISLIALIMLSVILIIISICIKISSPGPIIYWSKRIGRDGKIFFMPKFRSMRVNTPQVATELLVLPEKYITRLGSFLRKTSLDELPQFFSVLKGDMSIVGPRPALFNQDDLAAGRKKRGIDKIRPGITGWAQINGRDEISLEEKIQLDFEYLNKSNFLFDLKIIFHTFFSVFRSQNIKH